MIWIAFRHIVFIFFVSWHVWQVIKYFRTWLHWVSFWTLKGNIRLGPHSFLAGYWIWLFMSDHKSMVSRPCELEKSRIRGEGLFVLQVLNMRESRNIQLVRFIFYLHFRHKMLNKIFTKQERDYFDSVLRQVTSNQHNSVDFFLEKGKPLF